MNSRPLRLALFVPTYNSQDTVVQVLQRVPPDALKIFASTFVFDNQSSDQTVSQVSQFAELHPHYNLRVFRNRRNYLLGGSTVLALKLAIQEKFDYLVCMHSDGQADPADLPSFVKYCLSDQYDFILGSRLLADSQTEGYSIPRLWANQLFAMLQQPILRTRVYDLGAYVGFNLNTLKNLPFDHVPPDMAYHPNLILSLSRISEKPFRFIEFPIRWGGVHSSNINVFSYATKHLLRLGRLYASRPDLSVDYGKDLHTVQVWPKH